MWLASGTLTGCTGTQVLGDGRGGIASSVPPRVDVILVSADVRSLPNIMIVPGPRFCTRSGPFLGEDVESARNNHAVSPSELIICQ